MSGRSDTTGSSSLTAALSRNAPQGLVRAALLHIELTKARLVALVVMTAAVGFLVAAPPGWSGALLAWTLAGTALAAAGAMALNQRMEAGLDALMERTRLRPLPARSLSLGQATRLGVVLSTLGIVVLAVETNLLTAALGLAIIALYILVYTPMKRRSTACTLAGAVCGALPPMMGWSAAAGTLAFGAWVLAAILFLWQIPHFLSLAWLYREDYERGGFRMLPIVDPEGKATAAMVILYSLALLPVGLSATFSGMAGWSYAFGSVLIGTAFVTMGVQLARTRSREAARRVFFASLVYLPLLLGLMVVDRA